MCSRHKSPASRSWSPRAGLGNHDDVTLTWSGQRRCDIVVVPWAADKGTSPGPPLRTGALSHCAGPNRPGATSCRLRPGTTVLLLRFTGPEWSESRGREPGGRTALAV